MVGQQPLAADALPEHAERQDHAAAGSIVGSPEGAGIAEASAAVVAAAFRGNVVETEATADGFRNSIAVRKQEEADGSHGRLKPQDDHLSVEAMNEDDSDIIGDDTEGSHISTSAAALAASTAPAKKRNKIESSTVC